MKFDDLIKIDDKNYLKECIDKREELELNSYEVYYLIEKINDTEYTKECIKKGKELDLYMDMLYSLIEGINDQEYIKKCIENRNEIGLDSDTICKLINKTNDKKYIKESIERREELELNTFDLSFLIRKINDPEYTKKCISRREELGLSEFSVYQLIQEINQNEYFEECIKKRGELGLNIYNVYELINLMGGKEYLEQPEKREIINDSDLNKLRIIYYRDDLNNLLKKKESLYNRKINLPTEMKFGIEIECLGKETKLLKENSDIFFENWKNEWELSIESENIDEEGVEFISPILTGSNDDTTKEIRKVGIILNEFEQYVNDTCGGHIHIGADYLTNVEAWQNLRDICLNTEQILYIIGNEKGSIPRAGITANASPISRDLEDMLDVDSVNLREESDLKAYIEKIVESQKERERSINFHNLKDGGKGTIEFRLPNGTINPDTWIDNINLFGGIVKAAEDISKIQLKSKELITIEEKEILDCFENIRNKKLNERENVDNLLKIVIPEQDRYIYKERYNVNSEMIKQRPDILEKIKSNSVQGETKISKNKIIENLFNCDDRINFEEEQLAEQIINRDIEWQRDSFERGGR